MIFFFSSRRRHTRLQGDWSSDVCSSDLVDEPAEHAKQLAYVVEMQAGCRLVQHVDRPASGPALKLGGQLDPLRLAARQGRSGLAEPDVAEADIDQRLQVPVDRRHRLEELCC